MSKYMCEEDLLRGKKYLNDLLPNVTHIIKVIVPTGEEYKNKNTEYDKKFVFNHSSDYKSFGINEWLDIRVNYERKEVNEGNGIGKKNGFNHSNDYRYFILKIPQNVENVGEEIKKSSAVFLDEKRKILSVSKLTLDFYFPTYEIKI